jgi:hypothetical protein
MTTLTLAELVRETLETARRDLHTAMPGRVTTVRTGAGGIASVDVQPLIRTSHTDELGEEQSERLPVIPSVPIAWPGAGGFRLTFPIAAGDTGLLVFCEADLDTWKAVGGEVDPLMTERHGLAGAVFYPGLKDLSAPWPASTSDMRLGSHGGAEIAMSLAQVLLGGPLAVDAAVKGTTWRAAEAARHAGITSAYATLATAAVVWAGSPKLIADTNTFIAAINVFLGAAQSFWVSYESGASAYLSTKVKTE